MESMMHHWIDNNVIWRALERFCVAASPKDAMSESVHLVHCSLVQKIGPDDLQRESGSESQGIRLIYYFATVVNVGEDVRKSFDKTGKTPLETAMLYLEGAMQCKFGDSDEQQRNFMDILTEIRRETAVQAILVASRNNGTRKAREIFDQYKEYLSKSEVESVKHMLLGMNCLRDFLSFKDYFKQVQQFVSRMLSIVSKPVINRVALTIYKRRDQCKSIYQELVQFSSAESDSEEADVDIEAVSEFGSQESDSDGREMEKEGFLGFREKGENNREKKRAEDANVSVCSSASNRLSCGENEAATSKQQTTVNEQPPSASRHQEGPNSPPSVSSKQDSYTFKKIHPRQLRNTQPSSATSNEQIPSAKDLRIGRGSRPPSVTSNESETSVRRRRGPRSDHASQSSVGDIESRQSSKTKVPGPPPPSNPKPGSSESPFVVPAQRPPNTRHTNRPPSSRASSVRSSAGWSCMSGKCSHQKHPFTDLQDSYIIMGVEKFGFGSWKKIRCEYPFPEYRTPVHLKDRWRTMSGHGKVTIGQNGEIHLKGIYKTLVPHVRENRFKELEDSGTLISDRQTRRVRKRGKNTNEKATNGYVSANRSPVISSDAESTADMRGFEAIERWTRSTQDQVSSDQPPRRQIPPLFSDNRETTQRTKGDGSDANEPTRNDGAPNPPTQPSVPKTTGDYIQSTSKSLPHDIRPTSSNHICGAAGDATPSDGRRQHSASAGVEMREIPSVSSLGNNAAQTPDTSGPDSSRSSKNDRARNAGTGQNDEQMQGDFAGSEMSRDGNSDNAENTSAKRPNPSDQPEPKSESAGSEMSSSFIGLAQRKQPHDATQHRSSPRPHNVESDEINRSCDKSTDIVNRSSPTLSIPPAFDSPMPYTFETDESEDEDVSLKTSTTTKQDAQKICASIDLTGDEISENESEGEQADGGIDHPKPNPEMQELTEKMLSEPNEVTPDEDTIDLTGSPKQVHEERLVDGGTDSHSPSSVYYSATDGDTHSMGSVSSPEFTLAERMKDLETDQSAAEDDTMNESVIPNRTLTEEHNLNASVVLGAEGNGRSISLENVIELDAPTSVPHSSPRNTQSSNGNTGTVCANVEQHVEQDPSSAPSSSSSGIQSSQGNTGNIPDNVEQYMQEHPTSVPSSFSSSTQSSVGNTVLNVDAGNSSASCNVHEASINETGISVPSSSSSNAPVGNTEGSMSAKNSAQSQDGDQEPSSSVAQTANKEGKNQGLPSDACGSQSPRSTGFESGSVPNEQGCSEAIEIGRRHVVNTGPTNQGNSGNTPSTESHAAQPLDTTQNSDNSETSKPTGHAQEVTSSANPDMGTADLPDSQSRPFGRRTFKVTAKRSRKDPTAAELSVKTEPVDVGDAPWTTQGIVPPDSTSTTTDTTAKQSLSSARCDLQKNSQFMRNKLKTKQKNDATHETVIKIDSDSNDDSQKGSPSPPVTRNKLKNIVNQVESEVTSTPNTSSSNTRQTRSSSLAPNSQADSKGKKFLKDLPRLRRRKRKIIDLDQVGVPMKVSKEVEEQFRTNLVKAAEAKSVFETAGEKKGTSRKTWTAEEDENLRNGVERYGKGQWLKISESYTFRNRTTVNLKDRYRVLEEKGMG